MEEYEYEIGYIKSKENIIADCLSRLLSIAADTFKQAGIPEEEHNQSETEEPENQLSTSMSPERPDIYSDVTTWRQRPLTAKIKIKPNTIGKLWKEINKQDMPLNNEEEYLNELSWLIEEFGNKNLTIVRLIFGDPLFTPIQKEKLQEMIKFLSNFYLQLNFYLCFTAARELTKEEKEKILKEAHSTHLGEMNTLERAKKIGLCLGMVQR